MTITKKQHNTQQHNNKNNNNNNNTKQSTTTTIAHNNELGMLHVACILHTALHQNMSTVATCHNNSGKRKVRMLQMQMQMQITQSEPGFCILQIQMPDS